QRVFQCVRPHRHAPPRSSTMMFKPLKTSLLMAGLLAFSSGFGDGQMSKDDYKAGKDQIKATAKSDHAACAKMDGNAKDVCNAEAKAKEKVAMAELDAKKSGKEYDREN